MKKVLLLLLALVVVIVAAWLLLRQDRTTPDTQTLRVAVESEIATIDPLKTTENSVARLAGQVLEGLVRLDDDGGLQPALASSWESFDGGKRWRIQLRPDVRFHQHPVFGDDTSRAVTAEDVVFSFRRILSGDSVFSFAFVEIIEGGAPFRAGESTDLPGVTAVSPTEVEFVLTRPEADFMRRFTAPWVSIVPREQEGLAEEWGRTVLIGTGPFVFDSMSDTLLRLRRNPEYWGERNGNVENLEFVSIMSEPLRFDSLRAGRVDLIFATPRQLQTITEAQSGGELRLRNGFADQLELSTFSTYNSHFIGFNAQKLDVATRRTLSSAINRQAVVDAVLPGSAEPNDLPIPRGLLEAAPSLQEPAPGDAPAGRPVEVLVHDQQSAPEYVETAVGAWRKLGYEPVLRSMALPALIERIVGGDFEAAALWYEYPFSSPSVILTEFYAPDRRPMPNFFGYDSPAFSQFLQELAQETGNESGKLTAQRASTLASIMRDDPPAAFLFQRSIVVVQRRGIEGLSLDAHSIPDYTGVTLP